VLDNQHNKILAILMFLYYSIYAMNLNKHSFNREGYNPDMYLRFQAAVMLAHGALDLAGKILGSHTSAELEAYKIVEGAKSELKRIHFEELPMPSCSRENRKTPAQWCEKFGVEVIDDDGWRSGSNSPSWSDPCTQDMFLSRFMVSTTRIVDKEKYLTYKHLFQ
jgi:hypothetical protein